MRRFALLVLVVLLVSPLLAADGRRGKAPPVDPEMAKAVAPLVKQLDDPSWEVREEATQKLKELGPKARDALVAAAEDPSPEVGMRVRRILLYYREVERRAAVGTATQADWPALKRGPGRTAAAGAQGIRREPTLRWLRELPFRIGSPYFDSPLLVSGDRLYVVGRTGEVAVMERDTGAITATMETGEPVLAAPVLAAGTLYVPGRSLTALDVRTGQVKWRWKTDYGVSASPLVHADRVFAVEKGEKLVALNPDDGRVMWRARLEATTCTPVVIGDLVAVGTASGVMAYKVSIGSRRWSFETAAPVVSSPAVLPDRIVVADASRAIYAITRDKGKELWRRRIPEGGILETPVVYGNAVLFSTTAATFRAIRAEDGQDLWSRFVGNFRQSSPCVAEGIVCFTAGQNFWALVCADGDDIWRMQVGGIFSSPIQVGDTLYAVTVDGQVAAWK